jgi:hypothetical protein
MFRLSSVFQLTLSVVCGLGLMGCSDSEPSNNSSSNSGSSTTKDGGDANQTANSSQTNAADNSETAPESKKRKRGPLSLNVDNSTDKAKPKTTGDSTMDVFAAMKPLNVMLGTWEGKTNRQVGGFAALDTANWVWDMKTDKNQPALTMKSDGTIKYIQQARLTYLVEKKQFQLVTRDKKGTERTFFGDFMPDRAPKQIPDEEGGKTMHWNFKIQFTEAELANQKERWRIELNQLHNDRFLMTFYRSPNRARFLQVDIVANQRAGVSFAKKDNDYGDRECIISQGLGTIVVMYKGQSFYVCCSGCKDAFEDDPELWIARAEARKMKKSE